MDESMMVRVLKHVADRIGDGLVSIGDGIREHAEATRLLAHATASQYAGEEEAGPRSLSDR